MTMKKIILNIAVAMLFTVNGATNVNAQVTIGAEKAPEPFSVLELIANDTRGLRLPQMATAQRNGLTTQFKADETSAEIKEAAKGLQIFNIDTKCVETWNGDAWLTCINCLNAPIITTNNVLPSINAGTGTDYDYTDDNNIRWDDKNSDGLPWNPNLNLEEYIVSVPFPPTPWFDSERNLLIDISDYFDVDLWFDNNTEADDLPFDIDEISFPVEIKVIGGVGQITWELVGDLPPGLDLNTTTGIISGNVNFDCNEAGNKYYFTIKVTDAKGCSDTKVFRIDIVGGCIS
jgi:hypothetical protein